MDQKTELPEIRIEAAKPAEREEKAKTGWLASLVDGGGFTGAGGAAGVGGAGAASGSGGLSTVFGALFAKGGLLATKAGLVSALILGSAAAAGLGAVGYKILNPSSGGPGGAGLSLFAAKPKAAKYDPAALPAADPRGASTSLDYMAQAASRERAAQEAESAEAEDLSSSLEAPQSSGGAAPVAGPAANAPINADSGATGTANKALAGVKKFGAFSSGTGGAAAVSGAAGGAAGRAAVPALGAAGAPGSSTAFAKGVPNQRLASGRRGLARRGSANARRQLGAVMRDQKMAGTSMAAGATYDGSAGGGEIGPDSGEIVGDGATDQPKEIPANADLSENASEPPEPKPKSMITPWQKAVQRAQMLVMLALALAMAASQIPDGPQSKMIKMAIGMGIIAIGGYIGMLGGQVMNGKNGQKLQGQAVMAAAAGVVLTGIGVMMGSGKGCKGGNCGNGAGGAGGGAGGAGGASGAGGATGGAGGATGGAGGAAGGNCAGGGGGLLAGINPMILLGGGLAAVSMIGIMMMPKPKPIEVEKGQERRYDISVHAPPAPSRFV